MANVADNVRDGSFAQEMRKFLFYSKTVATLGRDASDVIYTEDGLRYAVGVFRVEEFSDEHYAVTCCHGQHRHIREGYSLQIYNEAGRRFETKVISKSLEQDEDFLLLRLTKKLEVDPPFVAESFTGGVQYLLMGYPSGPAKKPDQTQTASFLMGIVMCEDKDKNGRIPGTPGAMPGFSGGPAYMVSNGKFFGMCLSSGEIDLEQHTTFKACLPDLAFRLIEASYCRILPGRCFRQVLLALEDARKAKRQAHRPGTLPWNGCDECLTN